MKKLPTATKATNVSREKCSLAIRLLWIKVPVPDTPAKSCTYLASFPLRFAATALTLYERHVGGVTGPCRIDFTDVSPERANSAPLRTPTFLGKCQSRSSEKKPELAYLSLYVKLSRVLFLREGGCCCACKEAGELLDWRNSHLRAPRFVRSRG